MASLLIKVKTKMAIYAHEKVRGILEGEYGSVFKGRSMDFDDLRQYVPGDDVKDIDWKATARSGQTLIKRYVAIRKHNILLVVDTGKNMTARSDGGEIKRDIAIMTAGVLGYIAHKHGDLVAMVSGDKQANKFIPLKSGDAHLEHILQQILKQTSGEPKGSGIGTQLEYITKTMRRKMIVIVIADDVSIDEKHRQLLRRLRAQHEVMWITVGDLGYGVVPDDRLVGVESGIGLPGFVYNDTQVKEEFQVANNRLIEETSRELQRLGVSSERIKHEAEVIRKLFALLEKQRHAR